MRIKDKLLDKRVNRAGQRFTPSNELERVQEAINSQHPAEYESWDLHLFYNPVYKTIQKDLWKTKEGFSVKQTKDYKHVWKQATIGTEAGAEPYPDGHDWIGYDGVARKRNKGKELSRS